MKPQDEKIKRLTNELIAAVRETGYCTETKYKQEHIDIWVHKYDYYEVPQVEVTSNVCHNWSVRWLQEETASES